MSDDQRHPIEAVLPGFKLHPLDPGWTPLEAFVLVKSLDEDGDTAWAYRTSESLNLEELLGALVVQVETLKRELVGDWEDDESDT